MAERKKFAFALFEYVPYGGMQKNLLEIARTCMSLGHQVDIFCGLWRGAIPDGYQVTVLPVRGITNHRRCESFIRYFKAELDKSSYDAVVGFNKMPGLDLYYAADTCFAAKAFEKSIWLRLTGRYRTYLRLEEAVFQKSSGTKILLISEREKPAFMRHYGTPEDRFHLLPPWISRDRLAPGNISETRIELRRELGLDKDEFIILIIGSGFKTKGVDRGIRALASLPAGIRSKSSLVVVGEGKSKPFRRLADRLGVPERVIFVGGREDVPRFLFAADVLLHPAYRENTGTVLIEAMAAGLPVIATDICGYGEHIRRAGAGELIPSPFGQKNLDESLRYMLTSEKRAEWQKRGPAYITQTDVFSRAEKAAKIIEQVAGC
jgi:UDP-glucose:(heptosyl)LPS alpha-1,3-glucosyltransferase